MPKPEGEQGRSDYPPTTMDGESGESDKSSICKSLQQVEVSPASAARRASISLIGWFEIIPKGEGNCKKLYQVLRAPNKLE